MVLAIAQRCAFGRDPLLLCGGVRNACRTIAWGCGGWWCKARGSWYSSGGCVIAGSLRGNGLLGSIVTGIVSCGGWLLVAISGCLRRG